MWSDIKLVTTMVRNSRDTRRVGGDGVFDNNVAATADGALSKGSQFQVGILTFKDGVSVTAGLETECRAQLLRRVPCLACSTSGTASSLSACRYTI